MSYFGKKSDSKDQAIVTDRELLDIMRLLLKEVRLLNAMFDEAFDTKIHIGDIPDED